MDRRRGRSGEAQRLLEPAFAREIVDRFAGPEAGDDAAEVRRLVGELQAVRERLQALAADDGRILAQLEFARFAAAEIDEAGFEDHEDERLRERREVLANAERILTALDSASAALRDDGGVLDALGSAASALDGVARYGAQFAALSETIGALQSEVNDIGARLAREREAVETDPTELESIVARLDRLDRLKKKYGGSLAAVSETRAEFAALIERDASRDERTAGLERDAVRLRSSLRAGRRRCRRSGGQRLVNSDAGRKRTSRTRDARSTLLRGVRAAGCDRDRRCGTGGVSARAQSR